MSWYIWVWGVATTASMCLWAFAGVVAAGAELEKWKDRRDHPKIADLELKIEHLERNLKEQRKGVNDFGRICP